MVIERLNINITAVIPIMALTGIAILVLIVDLLPGRRRKELPGYMSLVGLVMLLFINGMSHEATPSFGGTVIADDFAAFFNFIFIIAGIITIALSIDHTKTDPGQRGEYYYIILFAIVGMMVMASANDLLNFYVGLELMALSFYILVALGLNQKKSVEGALKYFVLGALSSGILLYGISFAYGFGGSTNLSEIARQTVHASNGNPFLNLAVALIVVGFAFKVALFPLHIWAPDAYQAAPPPIAALLSVGSKAAALAVFLRIFLIAFPDFQLRWSATIWLLSAATMIFGSVVAISQKNIVRMMAYSSIAHAGLMVVGLLVGDRTGLSGILYYLLVYTFMNMGVFAVITLVLRSGPGGADLTDYKGLASRNPVCALSMALYMLALAGVPPTGGFTAKFFILASAINAGYYGLAAIGVGATAIALFFYAKVIYYMYMQEPDRTLVHPAPGSNGRAVLLITAVGTVLPGVYPSPFMAMAAKAVEPLFM